MNIVGIEVIRRNPGMAGNPITVGVPAGEKLPVAVGDTVRFHMTVDYRGQEVDGAIWTAIGWQVGVVIPEFIEVFNSRTPVHFDESEDFVTYPIDCDVDITDISGFPIEFGLYGNVLDMYAKIMEVPGPDAFTPIYSGVIEVGIEAPPKVELIQHTIYHFAYIYDGDEEMTTATFKTDPFTPSAWIADKFANKLEEEVRARGGHPLEVKVYVDKTPLLWTNFRIEVSSTPIGGVAVAAPGIAVGIPIWAAILIACLAITLVIVVATLAFKTVMAEFKRKPGLEDVKPAWGKEALILDIQDAEAYWERPLTPVETLEGMSEAELRDHLDQIAEEEVPPEISPWAIVALVGGLGVLGVGAAIALAAPKR
ncbi:hypothetical protein ES703_118768 [subsurface metagenome]